MAWLWELFQLWWQRSDFYEPQGGKAVEGRMLSEYCHSLGTLTWEQEQLGKMETAGELVLQSYWSVEGIWFLYFKNMMFKNKSERDLPGG